MTKKDKCQFCNKEEYSILYLGKRIGPKCWARICDSELLKEGYNTAKEEVQTRL